MNPALRSTLLQVVPFLFALVILLVAIKKGKIKKNEIGLNKPVNWKLYGAWVTGFTLYVIGFELLLYNTGLLEIKKWQYPLYISAIRLFGGIVLAPVVEEIAFRGVLFAFLQKKMKVYAAIIIQAIVFMLMHTVAYEFTLSSNIGIAQILFDSVLFALARLTTRSLATSITMHAIGNTIAMLERLI